MTAMAMLIRKLAVALVALMHGAAAGLNGRSRRGGWV
jgi:hypothetical protein